MTLDRKKLLLWTLAAGGIFLLVWQRVQAVRLGYAAGGLASELRRRRDATAYLRMELARLRTPERLDEAARRLGMGPATPECIVFLGSPVPRTEPAPSLARAGAAKPDEPLRLASVQ